MNTLHKDVTPQEILQKKAVQKALNKKFFQDLFAHKEYSNIASYIHRLEKYLDSNAILSVAWEWNNAFVLDIIGSNASYVCKIPKDKMGNKRIEKEIETHIWVYEKITEYKKKHDSNTVVQKILIPFPSTDWLWWYWDQLLIMDKIEGKTLCRHRIEKKYSTYMSQDDTIHDHEIIEDLQYEWILPSTSRELNALIHFSFESAEREQANYKKVQNFFVDIFWTTWLTYAKTFIALLTMLKECNIYHWDLHMRNIIITPTWHMWLIDFWMTKKRTLSLG